MPNVPGRPRLRAAALFVLLVAVASAAPARAYQILILGNPAGTQTATRQGGTARAEYSYNDRGRGDHIIATWKLDPAAGERRLVRTPRPGGIAPRDPSVH
jgi:hypothetical protein